MNTSVNPNAPAPLPALLIAHINVKLALIGCPPVPMANDAEFVEITDAMLSELEDLIKTSWENIKGFKFEKLPARDDDKCGHCDFNAICWGGDDG